MRIGVLIVTVWVRYRPTRHGVRFWVPARAGLQALLGTKARDGRGEAAAPRWDSCRGRRESKFSSCLWAGEVGVPHELCLAAQMGRGGEVLRRQIQCDCEEAVVFSRAGRALQHYRTNCRYPSGCE